MMPHELPHDCTNSEQPQDVTANDAASENAQSHPRIVKNWKWTLPRERAATLVAENAMSDLAICRMLNLDPSTLYLWRHTPEFAQRVEEERRDLANRTRKLMIRRKYYRLSNYDRRLQEFERIRAQRAEAPEMQQVPGGDTGWLVRQYKQLGRGKEAELIEEYKFDAALAKEMRELEELAAREVGDLVTKVAPTSPDGTSEYRARLSEAEFDKLPLEERIRLLQVPTDGQGDGAGG